MRTWLPSGSPVPRLVYWLRTADTGAPDQRQVNWFGAGRGELLYVAGAVINGTTVDIGTFG